MLCSKGHLELSSSCHYSDGGKIYARRQYGGAELHKFLTEWIWGVTQIATESYLGLCMHWKIDFGSNRGSARGPIAGYLQQSREADSRSWDWAVWGKEGEEQASVWEGKNGMG